MKRSIITMTALALMFSACENEQLMPDFSLSSQELTITASFGDSDGEGGKTSLQSGGSVWWNPGDALSLFYGGGTGGGSKFTADIESPASVANFTGVIDVITGGGEISVEDTWFWATYPYNPAALCDGSSITTVLPSEQTGCKGSFADNTFITVARSTGLLMSFYNVCSGLKFTVTNPDVEQVRFRSSGGEKIAGTARIKFDGSGIPYVDAITDGTDEIVVKAPDGGCFEVGEPYYVVLLPQTLSSGFTVTFDTWYEEAVREITKSATFKRAVFSTMIDADKNVEYIEKPYEQIFEDPDFMNYCIENFDTDGDGKISKSEAEAVTEINVKNQIQDGSITSLKGIGMFRNLETLYCCVNSWFGKGQLTSLDLSRNTALIYLDCHSNQLTSLDVSNNTSLTYLDCYYNQLTSLDVSKNTALALLDCSVNQLTSLDVSKNTLLNELNCSSNQLTSLDVSNNTALTSLSCIFNQLTSLDVSKNTALTYLSCYNNQLMSLDVSNTVLTELYCNDNQLTSLDVSKNTALTKLSCTSNQLTSLDVSKNTALTKLYCGDNQLTSLDVSNNTALTGLLCYSNDLTSLDVSNNTALTSLDCYSNLLTSLDVSNNTALTDLDCRDNQLTSLDVCKNTALKMLFCGENPLTSLDVSNNTALTFLHCCYTNQLTSLDVSKNTALTELWCSNNQLTSLDVSKNTALYRLYCSSNPLSYLYIYQGQSIPNVTKNRSTDYIPAETTILVASENGGTESTGEGENF